MSTSCTETNNEDQMHKTEYPKKTNHRFLVGYDSCTWAELEKDRRDNSKVINKFWQKCIEFHSMLRYKFQIIHVFYSCLKEMSNAFTGHTVMCNKLYIGSSMRKKVFIITYYTCSILLFDILYICICNQGTFSESYRTKS